MEVSSYTHWGTELVSDMSMGARHADPANPQIDEFLPDFKVEVIVKDRDEVERQGPTTTAEKA
jgi:hypothetical protein